MKLVTSSFLFLFLFGTAGSCGGTVKQCCHFIPGTFYADGFFIDTGFTLKQVGKIALNRIHTYTPYDKTCNVFVKENLFGYN